MEHVSRSVRLVLSVALLLAIAATTLAVAAPAVAQQPLRAPGLVVAQASLTDGRAIELTSPERFALTIDGGGIAAWYDLAGDPLRNLAPLVSFRGPAGEPFAGTARLVEATPLRAVVRLDGSVGEAPASITLTVWAGGQVGIATRGAAPIDTRLLLDPGASTGAALLATGAGREGAAHLASYQLYLGAWTPDGAVPAAGVLRRQLPVAPGLVADGPLLLTPPAGVLRQPRFAVAGWPGPEHSLSLAGRPLVAGVDYLAHWDGASGELSLQYLGLLPPGDEASRTFSLGPAQAPAIAVEILNRAGTAPRQLTPDGLLLVDANLPAAQGPAPGTLTTNDIFAVPYIQTWPELRLRATLSDGPAGLSGVRFTVSGPGFSQSSDDADGADGYSAQFNLPRRAEYSVTATALVSGQPAEPSKTIAQVAYGRVFLTVGDSITAGKWGFYRRPGEDGYPFTTPPASGGPYPRSADGRNYPQSDNSNDDLVSGVPGYENIYYQGYQVELNANLSACLNSPVFLLNSGVSGIRTARDSYKDTGSAGVGTNGEQNVLGKGAAYRSQLEQLGAGHVLLQVGTNDASTVASTTNQNFNTPMPASLYNQDLRSVVAALRQQSGGLNIWLTPLPWRDDKRSDDPDQVRAERRAKTLEFNGEIAAIVDDLDASTPTYLGPDLYATFDDGIAQGLIIPTDPTSGNPDRLHPTAAGYTLMAQQWASAICSRIPAEPNPGDPDPRPERIYLPLLASRP